MVHIPGAHQEPPVRRRGRRHLDREQVDEFLAERRNTILSMLNRRGDPVQVPAWFSWHDGTISISVTTERAVFPNLRRPARVALCFDGHNPPWRTALIRAHVRIIDGEEHWPHTTRIIDKYLEGERHDAMLERMRGEPRLILEITPDRIVSWSPASMDRDVWRAGD